MYRKDEQCANIYCISSNAALTNAHNAAEGLAKRILKQANFKQQLDTGRLVLSRASFDQCLKSLSA